MNEEDQLHKELCSSVAEMQTLLSNLTKDHPQLLKLQTTMESMKFFLESRQYDKMDVECAIFGKLLEKL
jgi:hypothetical protein